MADRGKPWVVVLGGNFAGLTAARFIRETCGDSVRISVIDRKPYLMFTPNIPLEVFANHDPRRTMAMPIARVLEREGTAFIQAEVTEIDVSRQTVAFVPTERPGAAVENSRYDYLVIALGARLSYDRIEGFAEHGHSLSDSYYKSGYSDYWNVTLDIYCPEFNH